MHVYKYPYQVSCRVTEEEEAYEEKEGGRREPVEIFSHPSQRFRQVVTQTAQLLPFSGCDRAAAYVHLKTAMITSGARGLERVRASYAAKSVAEGREAEKMTIAASDVR